MGIKALTWAFDAPLETGPKFVLIALADHASDHSGEDWTCFPSVERIMAMTGMSRSTVERHLKSLEGEVVEGGVSAGWITRKRRVRPDGRLGIYDYTLRRERLAEALAERAGEAEPHVKLTHGPGVNLTETMRQIDGKPHVNLTHEEPSLEPSDKPKAGAREPGDEGFEAAFAAFPSAGQMRSSPPAARAAWARFSGEIEPARLVAAIRRFAAEDPDVRRGVCPAFEHWLSRERFRFWLSEGPRVGEAETVRTRFAGPAALRTAIVKARGEGFAVSYLDRSAWDPETATLTPWSSRAADELRGVEQIIRENGATLCAPVPPAARAMGGSQ